MSVGLNDLALLTALVVVVVVEQSSATQFASQLRKCRVDNKEKLNTCLNQTLHDLRPFISTGIPELSLPPLEPLYIKAIHFRQGEGAVNIQATFTDVVVRGISNFSTTYINADPVRQELDVGLYIPELVITGHYELDGQIFLFPIIGSGGFWAHFRNVDANGAGKLTVEGAAISSPRSQAPPTGNERLRVSNTLIDFTIEHLKIQLDDLSNRDRIIGRAINLFINDNGREILQEVKPQIVSRLNDLVERVINDALSQLPVNSFLIP